MISCSEGQFSKGFSFEAEEYIEERQRSAKRDIAMPGETMQALEGLTQRS